MFLWQAEVANAKGLSFVLQAEVAKGKEELREQHERLTEVVAQTRTSFLVILSFAARHIRFVAYYPFTARTFSESRQVAARFGDCQPSGAGNEST